MRAKEFIKEIGLNHSTTLDINLNDYSRFFHNVQQSASYGNLAMKICNPEYDRFMFGLFDSNNLISLIIVEDKGHGVPQVVASKTELNYRKRGCFSFLLNYAVNRYGKIYSDDEHSLKAKDAWLSFISNTSHTINIFNLNTAQSHPWENGLIDYVWGDNPEIVIEVIK